MKCGPLAPRAVLPRVMFDPSNVEQIRTYSQRIPLAERADHTPMIPLQAFDPKSDYSVVERSCLPHWVQAGTICFITWRTRDSLPQPVVERWVEERRAWLRKQGINPTGSSWRKAISDLAP